jgi:hypothetical protein
MALNLDVDRLRGMLGRWETAPTEAGILARGIARAAAGVHLDAGHDVVVPQFVTRPAFLEQLERLADDVRASFHEIVLLAAPEDLRRRFTDRTRDSRQQVHVDAQRLLDAEGGLAALPKLCDRLTALLASRPGAQLVETTNGHVEEAYQAVLTALGSSVAPTAAPPAG